MKKVRTIIFLLGSLFFIIGMAGCVYMKLHTENTAIIGGADTPTFMLLVSEGGFLSLLSPILIIVGAVLVIISIVLRLKKGNNF
ncbi:MAG: hypothetical protein E7508_05850 [Ruminococcus sp.]|nr:hypothetical protein [Ruminococcus sp.]